MNSQLSKKNAKEKNIPLFNYSCISLTHYPAKPSFPSLYFGTLDFFVTCHCVRKISIHSMYFLNVSVSLYLQFLFLLVEALQCYSCKAENEELCEKQKKTKDCPNEKSCMTISYQQLIIESLQNVTQKDCSDELCAECSIMSPKYMLNCRVCQSITLRGKCPNTESAFSGPHSPAFILNMGIYSVNLCI